MYKPMKHLHKILSVLLLWGVSLCEISHARASETAGADTVVSFRFLPGENMFTRAGNEAELERLYVLIDCHKAEIAAGRMPYMWTAIALRSQLPKRI